MAFVGSSEEVSWAWSQALLLKAAQGSKAASTCGPGPGGARMSWAGGRALSRRVFVSPFAAASSDLRDSLAVCGGSLATHAKRVLFWLTSP